MPSRPSPRRVRHRECDHELRLGLRRDRGLSPGRARATPIRVSALCKWMDRPARRGVTGSRLSEPYGRPSVPGALRDGRPAHQSLAREPSCEASSGSAERPHAQTVSPGPATPRYACTSRLQRQPPRPAARRRVLFERGEPTVSAQITVTVAGSERRCRSRRLPPTCSRVTAPSSSRASTVELRDLAHVLADGDVVEPVTAQQQDGLDVLRHSAAHVLAQAVQEVNPKAKLGIGPPIRDGFYYDFDVETPFTPRTSRPSRRSCSASSTRARPSRAARSATPTPRRRAGGRAVQDRAHRPQGRQRR